MFSDSEIQKKAQTMYNNALFGIRKQGCQSLGSDDFVCMYRGDNGTKCALGHSIPDAEYRSAFEGCGIANNTFNFARNWFVKSFGEGCMELAYSLQMIHDKNYANFELQMKACAEQYGLTYTSLEHSV